MRNRSETVGKSRANSRSTPTRRHREHHIHRQRHLRLQPLAQGGGAGTQLTDHQARPPGIGHQRPAGRGQHRQAAGAVEQHHAQNLLQIADRVADHRLAAPQFSRGAGKAARVGNGDQHHELIDRGRAHIWHIDILDG